MNIKRISSTVSLVVATLCAGTAAVQAHADEHALALGDSVPFGYITEAGHEYVNADNFIGSPEYVGAALRLQTANASCPGETTASFLSPTGADHGCRAFRAQFPLHVPYASTQMAYAKTFLAEHRNTRLVTISLGANDLFLLEDTCATDPNPPQCIAAGLPAVLNSVGTRIGTVLAELRAAGFSGVIVIVNYYSLDYSDPTGTAITALLNQAIAAPAGAYGAVIADVFSAYKKVVSDPAIQGKTCNAGLLNVNPQSEALCDVHPSQSGQRLIAKTVTEAYRAASW